MIVELAPDYDLFVRILFLLWVSIGVGKVLLGLAGADKLSRDTYNIVDVLDGLVVVVLATYVVIG